MKRDFWLYRVGTLNLLNSVVQNYFRNLSKEIPHIMQANFVNASIHFAVVLPLLHNDDAKLAPIHLHALIRFVFSPHWFVNATFCTFQHPITVKNTRQIITFLPKLLHNSNKSRTFAPSVLAKPLNNAQIVRGVFCLWHISFHS